MRFLVLSVLSISTLFFNVANADLYNCYYIDHQTKEMSQMALKIEVASNSIVPQENNFEFMNALEVVEGNPEFFVETLVEQPVLWGLFKIQKSQKMLLKFGPDLVAGLSTVRMRRVLFDDDGRVIESRPYQCGKVIQI